MRRCDSVSSIGPAGAHLASKDKVLTTSQLATIEFGSVRRAQDRLRRLRELVVVFAFREFHLMVGQTRPAMCWEELEFIRFDSDGDTRQGLGFGEQLVSISDSCRDSDLKPKHLDVRTCLRGIH